ncbi:MAG: acyl-CoA dehydrogenase [candidate division KSB1 bacterium]|nr:acyl-CoA dehydrogenase [candidate division KSB1 bacterium]
MIQLTEEQKMVQQLAREFAQNEIAPRAAELDETGEFPLDNMQKMGELGLLGVPFSEDYGGAGLDTLSFALVLEELGAACGSTALSVAAHASLCCTPIYLFGNEEQKQNYLPDLLTGKKLGSFCLTEPLAGSDAASMQTRAARDGDEYVINGSKIFITNAGYADVFVLFAKTDPEKGRDGISAFIVEKGMPGFHVGKKEDKMGLRGSDTRQISIEGLRVPRENLLGTENDGFKIALATLDGGRVGIGAMSVGLARAAMETAVRYAKERVAFGRPIADFQAIRWYIADMATQIDAARLLVWRSAILRDSGKPYTKEAAMAKLFASEMAMRAADRAIQILGGYGYIRDYPVERIFRDTKLMEIGEGTSEIQRLVISREVLKEIQ